MKISTSLLNFKFYFLSPLTILFFAIIPAGNFSKLTSSVLIKLSLDDLIIKSDLIIIGKVLKVIPQTGKSLYNIPLTKNIINPVKCLCGCKWLPGEDRNKRNIEIITLGGIRGGVGTYIHGEAKFSEGEKVFVFLNLIKGKWRVVGMGQGKFTIVNDPETGIELILPPETPLLVKKTENKLYEEKALLTSPVALDIFTKEVIKKIKKFK